MSVGERKAIKLSVGDRKTIKVSVGDRKAIKVSVGDRKAIKVSVGERKTSGVGLCGVRWLLQRIMEGNYASASAWRLRRSISRLRSSLRCCATDIARRC